MFKYIVTSPGQVYGLGVNTDSEAFLALTANCEYIESLGYPTTVGYWAEQYQDVSVWVSHEDTFLDYNAKDRISFMEDILATARTMKVFDSAWVDVTERILEPLVDMINEERIYMGRTF